MWRGSRALHRQIHSACRQHCTHFERSRRRRL